MAEKLTRREHEVLRLVAGGYSNVEIAEQMSIALKTVETHVGNVFGKLQVRGRSQAILRAMQLGLLPPEAVGLAGAGARLARRTTEQHDSRVLEGSAAPGRRASGGASLLTPDVTIELINKLTLAVGFGELVSGDPSVPAHVRPWLGHALDGAWGAARIVRSVLNEKGRRNT